VAHVPVVSVGNLAMGGRGKTPAVAAIARLLVAAGERPAILSRGYRRRAPQAGVVVVSDGRHLRADLDRSGDEPLMLARQVPGAAVLVCRVRAQAAAMAESELGATVHVLDDGFQHRSLARDVDIVIVAPQDLRDRRVPFGRLRSSPRALARADAVIVDGATVEAVDADLDRVSDARRTRRFALTRRLGEPWMLEPGRPALSRATPVVAVAGIAAPERFSRALEQAGWRVARLVPFADHHRFTRRDLERVARALAETGAGGVVTTEKDAMRWLPLRPFPFAMAAVPLAVEIGAGGELGAWLLNRLREVRS
jgi:tetraacyldisaccharide 4'-kinase